MLNHYGKSPFHRDPIESFDLSQRPTELPIWPRPPG